MMKKTAIRVLSKLLPMSAELLDSEDEAAAGTEQPDSPPPSARLTTQAALDHFGGDTTKEVLQTETQPSDVNDASASELRTERETVPKSLPGDDGTAGAADDLHPKTVEASSAAFDDAEAQRLHQAFLDGQSAHKKGLGPRSPPEQYSRGPLFKAWLDGYDSVE
jgi:hypothetical protein